MYICGGGGVVVRQAGGGDGRLAAAEEGPPVSSATSYQETATVDLVSADASPLSRFLVYFCSRLFFFSYVHLLSFSPPRTLKSFYKTKFVE